MEFKVGDILVSIHDQRWFIKITSISKNRFSYDSFIGSTKYSNNRAITDLYKEVDFAKGFRKLKKAEVILYSPFNRGDSSAV